MRGCVSTMSGFMSTMSAYVLERITVDYPRNWTFSTDYHVYERLFVFYRPFYVDYERIRVVYARITVDYERLTKRDI
jgi:hypothetical protein